MTRAEEIYRKLKDEFGIIDATGQIKFKLKDFGIVVEQNNVVGNILEEWLAKWFIKNKIVAIHNEKQSSPDFWLNRDNMDEDWLEVKSFTGSPNFDIAAFRSFINLIKEKPNKLHSEYLLIKYKMVGGTITIENFWLKKIWEISCTSERFPLKVQYKNKAISNIRPAVWYSDRIEYPTFECIEDFISALEETIYQYQDTRHLSTTWLKDLRKSYLKHYGIDLNVPRWMDIAHKYARRNPYTSTD